MSSCHIDRTKISILFFKSCHIHSNNRFEKELSTIFGLRRRPETLIIIILRTFDTKNSTSPYSVKKLSKKKFSQKLIDSYYRYIMKYNIPMY